MAPRVTVLMPVFNVEKYLNEAIESILAQSFTDFEFIIINDGSTDSSLEIIKAYHDKRMLLIDNEINIGVVNSLNKGVKLARGEYIVRMDGDDISARERIKKQVCYMDKNPDIGMAGTWVETFGDEKNKFILPTSSNEVKCLLLFQPSVIHASAIMRTNYFHKYDLYYRESHEKLEDYDLWVRASMAFSISNIGEFLYFYRIYPEQVTSKFFFTQNRLYKKIRIDLIKHLEIIPSNEEFSIHEMIAGYQQFDSKACIISAHEWLNRLNNANKQKKVFHVSTLSNFLARRWFQVCTSSGRFGLWAYNTYFNSELSHLIQIDYKKRIKFLIKCIIKYEKRQHRA